MSSGGLDLQVSDLRQRFSTQGDDFLVIDEIRLSAGQRLGVAGASGAGKSTLFHCLAGLAEVQAGRIVWGDTDLARLGAAERTRWRRVHLGLVFQDFHLVEGLDALDNVLLPLWFDSWRVPARWRHRARELLEAVGVATPARRVAQLSRGERQRVAVARALLRAPPVLMADEPTASLDPATRSQVADLLVDLGQQVGSSLIVVSHEAALLGRMGSVLTLQAGRPRLDLLASARCP